MAKQGIDLKAEMAKRLKDLEEQFLKEKEEANQAFQQERKVSPLHLKLLLNRFLAILFELSNRQCITSVLLANQTILSYLKPFSRNTRTKSRACKNK